MQITAFITAALVAAVGASAASINEANQGLQKRYDFRQLYKFQGGDGAAACRTWKCNCINYVPKDSSLYFQSSVCEPGDYKGQNANSEAKASCVFTSENGQPKSINMHAAAASGFTLV